MIETVLSVLIHAVKLLPDNLFVRIRARVEAWDDRELTGPEKKVGVTNELKVIGIHGAAWVIGALIDLAVAAKRLDDGEIPQLVVKLVDVKK